MLNRASGFKLAISHLHQGSRNSQSAVTCKGLIESTTTQWSPARPKHQAHWECILQPRGGAPMPLAEVLIQSVLGWCMALAGFKIPQAVLMHSQFENCYLKEIFPNLPRLLPPYLAPPDHNLGSPGLCEAFFSHTCLCYHSFQRLYWRQETVKKSHVTSFLKNVIDFGSRAMNSNSAPNLIPYFIVSGSYFSTSCREGGRESGANPFAVFQCYAA